MRVFDRCSLAYASVGAGGFASVQMAELALGTAQGPADLAQRARASELAEQHCHEVPPAGEAAGVAPRAGSPEQSVEFGGRKQL